MLTGIVQEISVTEAPDHYQKTDGHEVHGFEVSGVLPPRESKRLVRGACVQYVQEYLTVNLFIKEDKKCRTSLQQFGIRVIKQMK